MMIRPLQADEYPLAAPIFAAQGGSLPDPELSTIIGAFDDENALVGLWTLQVTYHAGPLWIDPAHRGTRLWQKLHEVMCIAFREMGGTGFYSFAGSPQMGHVFDVLGYKDLGYRVYKKELT